MSVAVATCHEVLKAAKHPVYRANTGGGEIGGRGNYNERFLMGPLGNIPSILATRRVPTAPRSNGTIKINCSSCFAECF